ncbi:hypothetical protein [Hyalangium gracile]|uniref:hypothetical protein n=1 Tax=Hyalangium gracile TaxID=394092 RepID=UPI001CCDEAF5|nr:hypothetical protein [Hyalangium gracile]
MNPSDRAEVARRVDGILRAIAQAEGLPTSDERRRQLCADLMSEVYELGLALNRDPSLRQAPELARLSQARQHFEEEGLFEVQFHVGRLSQQLSSLEAQGWAAVCWRRSALAFFIELLGQGLELDLLLEDLSGLDEAIRAAADREGYLREEEIPPGIPVSHEWWWAPRSPPATRPGR